MNKNAIIKSQPIISFIILLNLMSCKNNTPNNVAISSANKPTITYHQAAEFEPTEAVWLMWSNYDHKEGYSNHKTQADIIAALLPYTKVKLIVPNDSTINAIMNGNTPPEEKSGQALSILAKTAIENGRLSFFKEDYREFWTRDIGPAFLVGSDGKLAMADFGFSGWGYGKTTDLDVVKDEKLDEKLADKLNLKTVSTDLITEGGDHEVNGKGILMACESVELTRNPTMSLAQIEMEFKRVLGIKKVIWLKKGLYEDDYTFSGRLKNKHGDSLYTVLTTNGHVDETARFVNDSTILLAEPVDLDDPIDQENKRRMDVNFDILKRATDQDGKLFKIVRMPLPKLMFSTLKPKDGVYEIIKEFSYKDGSIFPIGKPIKIITASSYLNFLIANDVVLMAKYGEQSNDSSIKKRDEVAEAVLKSVFPKKKIIGINAFSINLGGGGIHCITRNEPKL
jgi:agmatine deiminase